MDIDLSKLSAKELFELAQQKEKQEAEENARQERLEQLQAARENLLNDHKANLADIDEQIAALNAERETLSKQHAEALAQLDKDISALAAKQAAQPAAAPKAEPPKVAAQAPSEPPKSAPAPSPRASSGSDELGGRILEIMKTRPTISDSLLKERLKSQGFSVATLPRVIDQLIREKKIINKGSGNYALSKKH